MTDLPPAPGPMATAADVGGRPPRPPDRRFGPWMAEAVLKLSTFVPDRPLPRLVPMIGRVLESPKTVAQLATASMFGTSAVNPLIVKIKLDPRREKASPRPLGKVVAQAFPGYDRFVVNVGFACGDARALQVGPYTTPTSAWFNVFMGYYQIDVEGWGRPFGYQPGASGFTVDPAELARLGQADWNYFSNYLYGVPLKTLADLGARSVELVAGAREQVGDDGRWWDRVTGSRVSVSSAFTAAGDTLLRWTGRPLTELWRASFGQPYQAGEGDPSTSFFRTEISPDMLVCYDSPTGGTDGRFRTFVLGGVVNDWWADQDPQSRVACNRAFLDHQLSTVRRLATSTFAAQGFDGPGDSGLPGWGGPVVGVAEPIEPFSL